ncbi:hypothetical protein CI238_07146 [Colletotrichum incanum]|uniref:Uncharacterized protein n=1 Tax=Colletotrichum incanum TaxID=1573173 RepID=A0A162NLH5_COLIC|nr:hypothetical protein CI238_07146 [Colletotrichum incanum]
MRWMSKISSGQPGPPDGQCLTSAPPGPGVVGEAGSGWIMIASPWAKAGPDDNTNSNPTWLSLLHQARVYERCSNADKIEKRQ